MWERKNSTNGVCVSKTGSDLRFHRGPTPASGTLPAPRQDGELGEGGHSQATHRHRAPANPGSSELGGGRNSRWGNRRVGARWNVSSPKWECARHPSSCAECVGEGNSKQLHCQNTARLPIAMPKNSVASADSSVVTLLWPGDGWWLVTC